MSIGVNTRYPTVPSFSETIGYWVKLGFTSFGGPAGQIAMMQSECVDKRRWIGQEEYLRGLNYAMLLPGPEAQQLAAYIGWRLHGLRGALFAGTAFIVPGMLLMMFLAWVTASQGDSRFVNAVFEGVKPVVVAVIVHALWRIGLKACNTFYAIALSVSAFIAIKFLGISFPIVILSAGILGVGLAHVFKVKFSQGGQEKLSISGQVGSFQTLDVLMRWVKVTLSTILVGTVPCVIVVISFGTEPFIDIIQLFTTAALITFGGAYAVLPYIADAAVNIYKWVTPSEMINGLALAETTPGPLILVTTFVGFFAGWNSAGIGFAMLSAALTTFVTFLPSFLFIIAGAPYIESLQARAWARNALAAITAAIVGVIFNLAVYFGETALILDGSPNWINIAICSSAFGLLCSKRVSVPLIVALGALLGAIINLGL